MNFNNQQKRAIETNSKRVLVLAGPGSGKTRVLVQRIVRLIKSGTSGYDILCLTFTRKAAEEMKKRLIDILPENVVKKMWICTFHSACLRMLKEYGELLGYNPKQLSIYDDCDQRDMLIDIIASWPGKFKKKNLNTLIMDFSTKGSKILDEYREAFPEECKIFDHYLERLRENNAVDFGLILTEVERLFENFPETKKHYQQKFQHVLIDEYQDTDRLQYNLHSLIDPENLFCVGDSDQAIYSFRGATVDIILDFSLDYFDAEIIELPKCYRCAKEIVYSANNLIRHNQHRIAKEIEAARTIPGEVNLQSYDTPLEMARDIAQQIKDGKFNIDSTAILSRTKKRLNSFEEIFKSMGIPYIFIGADSDLYKNKEIKQFHSLLSLVINPFDNLGFLRVRRLLGINDVLYQEIRYIAVREELSHMQAWEKHSGKRLIADSEKEILKTSLSKWTQIFQHYFDDSLAFSLLKPKIDEFIAENDDDDDIESYLNWLQSKDVIGLQDDVQTDDGKVKLMTIHAAKGLEFQNVVVAGMTEGHLPHSRAGSDLEIEEERRLLYVAITRAKDKLMLCYSKVGLMWNGNPIESEPSRFLKEIN